MTSVVNTIKQLRYKRASILRDMKGIKQSLEDGVNVPDWVRSDSLRKMSSEVTRLTHCIEQENQS
jgi:hypothetical protein